MLPGIWSSSFSNPEPLLPTRDPASCWHASRRWRAWWSPCKGYAMSARKSLWVSIGRHGNDWSLFTDLNGNYWNLFTDLMRTLSKDGFIPCGSNLRGSFERAAYFVDRSLRARTRAIYPGNRRATLRSPAAEGPRVIGFPSVPSPGPHDCFVAAFNRGLRTFVLSKTVCRRPDIALRELPNGRAYRPW